MAGTLIWCLGALGSKTIREGYGSRQRGGQRCLGRGFLLLLTHKQTMMFDGSRLKWTGLLPWLLLLSRVHVAIFGVWGVLPTAATSLSPHLLCPSFSAGSSASFHPSGCSIWPHLGFLLTSVHQTLLLHLPAIGWLVTCMSEDLTDHGVVDITLRIRGLTISVSGPAAQATSFVDSITRGASNSSRASEVGSSGSFSVVDTVGPEPAAAAAPRVQETRQQIEASFDPCPGYLLNSASRLGGSLDCARSRIRRAYRAGQWAGAVLSERAASLLRGAQSGDFVKPKSGHNLWGILPHRWGLANFVQHLSRFPIWDWGKGLLQWSTCGLPRCAVAMASLADGAAAGGMAEELELAFNSLVTLEESKTKYILEWVSGDGLDGAQEAIAFIIMKRAGGLLVALPVGIIPAEELDAAQHATDGLVGPSTVLEVPGVVDEQDGEHPTGISLQVQVVDLDASSAAQFRVPEDLDDFVITFSAEDQFATPEASSLMAMSLSWLQTVTVRGSRFQDEGFYSADAGTEQDRPVTPGPKRKPRRGQDGATPSGPPTPGQALQKSKRPTTASLQASLDSVLATLPELSNSMKMLADRQTTLENKMTSQPGIARSLAQPLSSQVPTSTAASAPVRAVAQSLMAPPRTTTRSSLMALQDTPQALAELEEEKPQTQGSDIARAMLAQSAALTTLVAQLTGSSQDPMADLQLPGGSGTRGSSGRARLQAELATHQGLFYDSVLRAMARRMSPTTTVDRSPQELLAAGISGTRYLERFGGYGRQRELGLVQFQLMTALDFLMAENLGALKDTLALLIVCIEQAVLNSGRFEVAQILTLQEDVPSGVFTNRQLASTSRARAFAPLSDPRWVTTAIAFLKELDTITAKRTELLNPSGGGASSSTTAANQPQAKPKAKRKGGGRGRGQQQQNQTTEEEEQ